MASVYAQCLQQRPDTKLVAAVGNSVAGTERFARAFEIPGYPGAQYERMLFEHPETDAIVVATPEWVRDEPVIAALKSRKHILLEKPLADSWSRALKVHHALQESTGMVDVCQVLRHSPRFCALQRVVKEGQIGEVRHIYARRHSNNVRVRRVLGKTDLVYWLATHDVDLMRWIIEQEVESLYAVSRSKLNSADDYLIANIHFQGGVDAVLEISWCGPPLSGTARSAIFEIRGSAGSVEVDDSTMNIKVFREGGTVAAPDTYEDDEVQGQKGGYFRATIDHFITNLYRRAESTSLADAFEAARVCAMIRKSIDESRIVVRAEIS
jgi:predicted dehydrogenase